MSAGKLIQALQTAIAVKSPSARVLLRIALGAAALGVTAVFASRWWLPPAVDTIHPHRGQAVQAVYATGTVEPSIMLPIAARISARLVQLDADEGQSVHKGDVIGRLEDTDLKHALAQLRSQETFARREFERNATLAKSGLVARTTFDRSRSDWQAASAASARAAAEMDFTQLIAPADGTIIHRDGEIGQLIPVNQPVFWISVDSPLRISAEVDEEDIARVQPGQQVLIRADAFPGRVFQGQVQSITPKGDPVARSYRVRMGLSEATPLLIGMTAETNIVIRKDDNALLLPPGAVQSGHVWRIVDGKLESTSVKVGANGADAVEIVSGLEAGDSVIAQPDASLRAGQRVRAVPRPGPRQ